MIVAIRRLWPRISLQNYSVLKLFPKNEHGIACYIGIYKNLHLKLSTFQSHCDLSLHSIFKLQQFIFTVFICTFIEYCKTYTNIFRDMCEQIKFDNYKYRLYSLLYYAILYYILVNEYKKLRHCNPHNIVPYKCYLLNFLLIHSSKNILRIFFQETLHF